MTGNHYLLTGTAKNPINHYCRSNTHKRLAISVFSIARQIGLLTRLEINVRTNTLAVWKIGLIVILICIETSVSVATGKASGHKMMFNEQLVIEHLELISPLRGAQYAQGYFAIWNGTARSIYLEKITDPSGRRVKLQKLTKKASSQKWSDVALPKTIPPKSEFTVQAEQFRMLIDANAILSNKDEIVPISFHFEDRKPVEKAASVLPFGSQPTDHHHGLDDNDQ